MEEDESEKSWGRRCILWVLSKLDMQQEPRLGIGFSIAAERSTLLENKRGEAALWRQKEDLNFHNRSPPVAFYLIVCNFAFTITQMGFFDNFIFFERWRSGEFSMVGAGSGKFSMVLGIVLDDAMVGESFEGI